MERPGHSGRAGINPEQGWMIRKVRESKVSLAKYGEVRNSLGFLIKQGATGGKGTSQKGIGKYGKVWEGLGNTKRY